MQAQGDAGFRVGTSRERAIQGRRLKPGSDAVPGVNAVQDQTAIWVIDQRELELFRRPPSGRCPGSPHAPGCVEHGLESLARGEACRYG